MISPPPPQIPAGPQGQRLLRALREDLESAGYGVSAVRETLGPVAHDALSRENPVPARRLLAAHSRAGQSFPALELLNLFTLGGVMGGERISHLLPRLGLCGAMDLGLITPVSDDDLREDATHPVCPDADLQGSDSCTCDDARRVPDTNSVGETSLHAAPSRTTSSHVIPSRVAFFRATVDLRPYEAEDELGQILWWITSDLSELATGRELAPDHVLGVGGASTTLARITPRPQVKATWDLGCGCGIQALHAARHSERVVATDLSPRAIAFARFNAELNGVALDLRVGSLFEPVDGERFDLIVSNPPFVITPRVASTNPDQSASTSETPALDYADHERTLTYRDGGRSGDRLLAEVTSGLGDHLNPGGIAVMLGNWEIPSDTSWDTHPRAWAAASGLNTWVIQRDVEDPARYAETWTRDGGIRPGDPRYAPMISRWLDDFDTRHVHGVGFGYLLFSRPEDSSPPTVRTEDIRRPLPSPLGPRLLAILRREAKLLRLTNQELCTVHLVHATDVIERRHLTPGSADPLLIELVQGDGLAATYAVPWTLAAVFGALDGALTLGQVVAAVAALTETDHGELLEDLLPRVRELIRDGLLLMPDSLPLAPGDISQSSAEASPSPTQVSPSLADASYPVTDTPQSPTADTSPTPTADASLSPADEQSASSHRTHL
ncbi:DUF7059 domain-containing protein [Devriesea agamarum]|uniref:DUF7059 domain-containing protein n=1 Tax=Devriesea agamarum TaxID=472569 RepID=UPI000A02B138|nr:methyltransferase [Devriesea agamarum]